MRSNEGATNGALLTLNDKGCSYTFNLDCLVQVPSSCSLKSVSYTHLDVYKRQVLNTCGIGEDRLREMGSLPATFYVF